MLTFDLYTPSDDARPVYVAGNFNDWKTRDERFRMEKLGEGRYRLALKPDEITEETIEYKYVKGGWDGEELSENGVPINNRRLHITHQTVQDIVPMWKKHGNWYDPTFYPEIEIVGRKFNIPQLRRRRRISILLPYNYYQTERRYPVLYLQDGQNLFEPHAPFGTWAVDKQMAALAQRGKGDFIVVAIDHGGKDRVKEFLPFSHLKWGHGLGKEYARFLTETLKPYIDHNYRTLPERQHTGIGGSSMGGIISIYAGLMFPQVYSKFMIFSPSLWISPRIFVEAEVLSSLPDTKIYLYAGGREGASMVSNAQRFVSTLAQMHNISTSSLNLRLEIDPDGQHNEYRWGLEFPKAAEWLFFD